eukprot:Phypoly_transcript_00591.p1 GENE.Phypoly_transcript_00591~~Phypoly_transcript_00591.p1  ORF type:complete len:1441 (+),score=280.99 Phypoly_transcript_00591:85-4407(+)
MPFAMDTDGDVDLDMSDSQFLLSLKPASKEEEVEEKIQRIAEGKAREGVDISVYDALDYIASITKMGKTYYQARASFVWQYLQNQRQAGVLSANDIVTPLLEKLDAPNSDFILVACTILHDLMPTYDVATSLRVISKLMSISHSYPEAMAPREWDSIHTLLRLLHNVITSPYVGLPLYYIYSELPTNAHWTMQGWLTPYQKKLSRLCCLFAPSGFRQMCTVMGLFRLEEAKSIANSCKNVARYVPSPDWGRAWHTCVHALHHLICQGAPLEWIQAHLRVLGQLMENYEYITHPMPSSTNGAPTPTPPKSAASQLLLEAAVMRVMDLVEVDQDVKGKSMEQLMTEWWGEWCCFADQFYIWVEIGMLDYEKFVLVLAEKYTRAGNPLKDNAIIWLLGQCLPLDHVKEMFRAELMQQHGAHYGRVFPFVISLFNESQLSEDRAILLRDTAVLCLAFRIYGIIGPSPASTPSVVSAQPAVVPPYSDVKKYITRMSEQLGTKVQEYRVQEYKNWWTRCEGTKEKIDYFNAPESVLVKVSILSFSMSQPISSSIMEFMCTQAPKEELFTPEQGQQTVAHFPGFLGFNGRVRAFQLSFLAQLAIRCRQRILDMIMAGLSLEVRAEMGIVYIQHTMPIPPGMMETFVRLLYITPSANRNRYRLHTALQNGIPNDMRCNAILDMVNFRLIRYFKHFNSIKHLFLDVHEWIIRFSTNHQLYDSVTSLMIKLCTQLNDVLRFAKTLNTINFGETINRLVILSLARVIKTRGAYDFSKLKDIPLLLARLHEVSPHLWSPATLRYFPAVIHSFYSPPSPSNPTPSSSSMYTSSPSPLSPFPTPPAGPPPSFATLELVTSELERNLAIFNAMDQTIPNFVTYFQSAPQNKPLFLCEVWMFILRNGGQSSIERCVHTIFYSFTAAEVNACTYTFISFLLDESPLQPRPISRYDPAQRRHIVREPAPHERMREACTLLANFVYSWHILPLEVTLLALMDRDDDPNVFTLLEHLLLDCPHINQRLDAFYALNINNNLWKEDAYFQKNLGYNTTFQDYNMSKSPLPIYYGNTCLRLLPVLDLLLRRLIEQDQAARLEKFIDRYHQLYVYHDTPISNVSDILFYYYDAPLFTDMPDTRLKLLRLLEGAHGSLAEMFKAYITSKKLEHIVSPVYFESVVQRIESVINVHTTEPPFYNSHQIHFFHEFPSATEGCLVTTLMELMFLPLSPKDISNGLFSYMANGSPHTVTEGTPFHRVAAVAVLFARLPAVFHGYLFEHALRGLKDSPHFDSIAKIGATSRALFVDFSANSETLMTNPINTALVLLHVFYTHASAETFLGFPAFVRSLHPMRNIHQFFVVCKAIAPFLVRIATGANHELLQEILVELLKGLKDVEATIIDEPSPRDYDYDDYASPTTIFDIVVDFFFHCKTLLNLKATTLAAMHEIIFTLKPHVQLQFKHF